MAERPSKRSRVARRRVPKSDWACVTFIAKKVGDQMAALVVSYFAEDLKLHAWLGIPERIRKKTVIGAFLPAVFTHYPYLYKRVTKARSICLCMLYFGRKCLEISVSPARKTKQVPVRTILSVSVNCSELGTAVLRDITDALSCGRVECDSGVCELLRGYDGSDIYSTPLNIEMDVEIWSGSPGNLTLRVMEAIRTSEGRRCGTSVHGRNVRHSGKLRCGAAPVDGAMRLARRLTRGWFAVPLASIL